MELDLSKIMPNMPADEDELAAVQKRFCPACSRHCPVPAPRVKVPVHLLQVQRKIPRRPQMQESVKKQNLMPMHQKTSLGKALRIRRLILTKNNPEQPD